MTESCLLGYFSLIYDFIDHHSWFLKVSCDSSLFESCYHLSSSHLSFRVRAETNLHKNDVELRIDCFN